ncbi:GlsB/YeaQ/YmgE family stress response membrane protein [Aestuariimicrobium sp. p3-SID1156]|uniref:GlsB/YeaQ/YmgE family stress response membrane protein n=1 Tax=Aestuariimicrobium sp. p3-SID1156 TaxID=2916038 RepID=UPI0021E3B2E9|nr:GlsB/YeaQ/YmgE family stress response membrane protein [Aestuariimicrobium sp. p3-SID1156]MCT1460273.1 GlsB/YeaQ/YmgE family stress response membrane protein [Aestuariimicrobium sp. p3-SID1156]
MGILAWILLGLIAGAIAKAILPGEQGGGWLATIILGIVGAMVGGFLGSVLFDVDLNKGFFNLSTWISAIGGSLIVLLIWGFIRSRTSRV